MNPKDVREKKFEKATFGYKPEEVDDYLKEVAAAYAESVKLNQENEAKLIKLVEKINEYREDEEAIKQTLISAQKSANRIISDAKAEADKLLSDAKAEHAKLIEQNNEESERIIKENSERCERLIKETAERTEAKLEAIKLQHENAKENLEKMKVEVTKFKAVLIDLYSKQLKQVEELPELSEEEIQKAIKEKTDKINAAKAAAEAAQKAAQQQQQGTEPVIKETANKEQLGLSESFAKGSEQFGDLKFGKNN